MTKKLLKIAREGLSFCSDSKLRPTSLSLIRSHKSVPVDHSVKHTDIQRCGWSHFAAAAPSDKSNAPKARKKIPRDERRALVESYVNEYRVINAGKFPKISDARKQVGGSYYVVRKIIQELECKSKVNSSNNTVENMVEKEIFDEEKPLSTEAVKVSSGKTQTAIARSVQKDFQLVDIDKGIANADYEHLEENRMPQSNSWERSMSQEAAISTIPGGHFTVEDSKSLKRDAEELSQSSLQMMNDVKTEETESNRGSISPESHLLMEGMEHVSASFGKKSCISHCEAQSHYLESLNMESHLRNEKESIEKSGYETREQAGPEEPPEEPFQSSIRLTSDVKAEKAESNLSDHVAPESHLLKDEIEQPASRETNDAEVSRKSTLNETREQAALVEPPEEPFQSSIKLTSDVKAEKTESNLSEHVATESHLLKEEIERQASRETSDAEVSRKSTFWGNLKSFADGIMNIWRRL